MVVLFYVLVVVVVITRLLVVLVLVILVVVLGHLRHVPLHDALRMRRAPAAPAALADAGPRRSGHRGRAPPKARNGRALAPRARRGCGGVRARPALADRRGARQRRPLAAPLGSGDVGLEWMFKKWS